MSCFIIFLWPWCMHIPFVFFIPSLFLKESEKNGKVFLHRPATLRSEWLKWVTWSVEIDSCSRNPLNGFTWNCITQRFWFFSRHSNIYKGGCGECLTSKKRFWRQENWPNRRSNTKNKDKPGAENEKSWYKKNHYIFCFKITLIQYSAQKNVMRRQNNIRYSCAPKILFMLTFCVCSI